MGPFISILRSLILTLLISTAIAASLLQYGFWQVFVMATGTQIILFAALNSFRDINLRKIEVDRIKSMERQGLSVVCPCHKAVDQFIPVTLNSNNSYICDGCDKRVNVQINAETVMATLPVDLEQSNRNIDAIYNSITTPNPPKKDE